MSQMKKKIQQNTTTRKKTLCNASGSNLPSFLNAPTPETNNIDGIQFSKSASSDTDAVLHRYQTENFGIKYSGYLLKRSNRPYVPNQSSTIAASDTTASSTSDLHDNCSKSVWSSATIPLPNLEKPQLQDSSASVNSTRFRDKHNKFTSSTSKLNNNFNNAIRFAAFFFGYLPEKPTLSKQNLNASSSQPSPGTCNMKHSPLPQKTKSSPVLTPTKSKPIVINGSSLTTGPKHRIPIQNNIIGENKNGIQTHDDNSCVEESLRDTCGRTLLHHDGYIPPPPDHHDPKDGHIWRSKYCVLENGVLYFYCNAEDGNSIEAQEERDQTFPSYDNNNVKCIPSSGVTKSSLNNDIKSDGYLEADHLAKSPMPRSYLSSVPTAKDKTGRMHYTYSNNSTSVMWEKRVALDRVGSVLASEADFGKQSFVLLGIDSKDDHHDAAQNLIKNNNVKNSDTKTCINAASPGDRLILRAASPDDMGNWIFEIHRSLQTLVNNIVRNRVTSVGQKSRRLPILSSEGHRSHMGFGPNNFISRRSTSPTSPPTVILSTSSLGGFPSTDSMELSHGHGRSGLHRQRMKNEGKISAPSIIPGKGSLLAPFLDTDRKIVFSGSTSYLTGSSNIRIHDTKRTNSATLLVPINKEKQHALEPSVNKCKEPVSSLTQALNMPNLVGSQANISGKYVPPQKRRGKYVPPHRRKEEEGKQNITESISIKNIFRDKPDAVCVLQSGSNNVERLGTEDDKILHSNNEKIGSGPLSSLHHNDSDPIVGPSKRLGGCADPTLIEGSICDPMYIKKKSSVVGKVDSKPYGSFGGCQSSGKADQSNNIQWEVGAVSKCGIRSSNEDSYLVLNDLLAEATIKDDSTSFFKSFQSHGIFAIFDGHCGNHTARFAAEKFPSILLDESMKDEFMAGNGKHMSNEEKIHHLLKSVLIRLDCEFCDMCTANGRDWESGATALIAIVIGDTLAVAGLGDSNGVLSCTLSEGSNIKENGWSKLDNYRPKGCSINHGADVVWKKIVKTHSPSREDERKRIEEANGWITTETEISCSQIHRVNWDDYDVIDIVGRSIGNGKAEVGRILSISRVCGDLAVSRALGDKEFKAAYNILHTEGVLDEDNSAVEWESDSVFMKDRLFKGDLISSIPEINLYSLGEGKIDEFLLLACDGLWDVMDAIDAVRITRNLLFEKGFSAKESADRLAELAKGLGSSDNISVIVVHFHVEEKG